MTDKTIKSGQEVIKDFLDHAGEDSGVDKGSIEAIKTLLESEGKVSGAKLLKELERLRKV
jgi:hypothetical protein